LKPFYLEAVKPRVTISNRKVYVGFTGAKPAPAKSTHFQNLAISKLEGLAIPVSKSGRLFGCPPVSKQGVTASFGSAMWLAEFKNV